MLRLFERRGRFRAAQRAARWKSRRAGQRALRYIPLSGPATFRNFFRPCCRNYLLVSVFRRIGSRTQPASGGGCLCPTEAASVALAMPVLSRGMLIGFWLILYAAFLSGCQPKQALWQVRLFAVVPNSGG